MTRQWTIEELDRVHPFSDERKAEGWQWMDLVDQGQGWAAVIPPARNSPPPHDFDYELGILAAIVWVDSADRVRYEGSHPPVDVTLAVLLASKGLDSMAHRVDFRPLDEKTAVYQALVQLQRKIDARLKILCAGRLGATGVRDPDAPCDGYDPGEPGTAPLADCDSDGHYLCAGCKRLVVCRTCGKHCQAVAPSTCAPDCTEPEDGT